MSKIKGLLEEDMMRNPELYNGWSDYEFWIQCRKEAILEREGMDSETNKTKGNKDGKIPTR